MTTAAFPSRADWTASGARLEVLGHRLFVVAAGSGPHLTLLHGFPTCSWDFSRVWPALAAARELLAVDLLGFGDSDKPAGRYSFEDHADRVEQLWVDRGVHSTTLIAHDYSVTLALELLARRLEGNDAGPRIDGVVFLNGALRGALHRMRPIQRVLRSPVGPIVARLMNRRRFARAFRQVFVDAPGDRDMDDFWASIRRRDGHKRAPALLHYIDDRRARAARWEGALLRTATPLSFVWGTRDPVSGAHVLDAVRDRGRVFELPVGHYPHWEAPAAVANAILEFT